MNTATFTIPERERISGDEEQATTCYYSNHTPYLEILRISNVQDWYFEKLIFPRQRLTFESPTQGVVEIYTTELGEVTLVERLLCGHLQIAS
ncbi:MAG: DUF1830 domain-containing protein [Cyanobacteria bacterium J06636_16]